MNGCVGGSDREWIWGTRLYTIVFWSRDGS